MAKKSKTKPTSRDSITVGNINNATGIAVGSGATASVSQSNISSDLTKAFVKINKELDMLQDGPHKSVAQTAVQGLEVEAHKGEKADEKSVSTWINFLAQAAPDIWNVAVTTFSNPISGLSRVFQLVAARAMKEKSERKDLS